MFFSLSYELIQLVESFNKYPYWKNRFSQDVVPCLNKGWRLATIYIHEGIAYKCANCYSYGEGGTCLNCDDDYNDLVYMSFEEYVRESRITPDVYTYDAFQKIKTSLYGKMRGHVFECSPDYIRGGYYEPMAVDLRNTAVFYHIAQYNRLLKLKTEFNNAIQILKENNMEESAIIIKKNLHDMENAFEFLFMTTKLSKRAYNTLFAQNLERRELIEEDKILSDIHLLFH